MRQYHTTVLKKEVIDLLNVKAKELYIDATIGGGGHAQGILENGGIVLGLDQDPEAISNLEKRHFKNLKLVRSNFSHLYRVAQSSGFKKVSGIIFDLGVSSHQLDTPDRGFSFLKNGFLDMRMDPQNNISAYDLINKLDKRRLYEIFKTYGQEKLSWPIVNALCIARQIKPISSTRQLAILISEVYRKYHVKDKHIHPATRAFQALRIVINSELINLKEVLPQTLDLLKENGRLVIISFNSLEDSIVKRFFRRNSRLKTITRKPIGPGLEEILNNPRARSAKLRCAQMTR